MKSLFAALLAATLAAPIPASAGRESSEVEQLRAEIAALRDVVEQIRPKKSSTQILAEFRRSAAWTPGATCEEPKQRLPSREERNLRAWGELVSAARSPIFAASSAKPTILGYGGSPYGGGSTTPGSGGLPSGCTDNTIARADGTAGATQCSAAIVEDDGDLIMASGDVIRPNANNPTALHYATDDDSDSGFASNVAFPALRVSGTNVLIATTTGLNIFDANVGLSETGTNDLALTADGAVHTTFSSAGVAFASGVDTLVPADGTMNVTGAFTVSGDVTVQDNDIFGGAGLNVSASAGVDFVTLGNAATTFYQSNVADGGSAIAHRFAARQDLATAGAKIASFGDNTVSSYAEKAYIGLDGTISAAGYRGVINATLTAAAADLTADQFRASHVFPANTGSNAVDVEISQALDALDVGMEKIFRVATGHATNALTVTADASGVTTATLIQQGVGASCEDANDFFRVTVKGTQAITVESYCAD